MFIHAIAHYVPTEVVNNAYFQHLNGLTDEWITERTGIRERRRAAAHENTNTLALSALEALLPQLARPVQEIDLVVGATYTPYDTIYTLAHAAQRHLGLGAVPVVSISSACSSLLNALEIVEGYFAMGKARQALVLVAEHNTRFSDPHDANAGHLWGDGAAALLLGPVAQSPRDWEVLDLMTAGAAHVGKADEAVVLRPVDGGFTMPYGRDVFQQACLYMAEGTQQLLARRDLTVDDLTYFVPHQANWRISRQVMQRLSLTEDQVFSNIQYLGNTGCAGAAIALSENRERVQKGDLLAVSVFGGGYSFGAMLLRG